MTAACSPSPPCASTARTSSCIPATPSMPTARSSREVKLPDGKIWKNVTIPEKAKVAETLDEFRAAHKYNFTRRQCARLQCRGADLRAVGRPRGHQQLVAVEGSCRRPTRSATSRCSPPARRAPSTRCIRCARASPSRAASIARSTTARISTCSCSTSAAIAARTARTCKTAYGPDSLPRARADRLAEARAAEFARDLEGDRLRHAARSSSMTMPPTRRARKPFAQGDGPARGRELEIADLLRFIKTAGDQQHRLADRRRALRRRAPLQSRQGAVPGFRAVLGVRLRARCMPAPSARTSSTTPSAPR